MIFIWENLSFIKPWSLRFERAFVLLFYWFRNSVGIPCLFDDILLWLASIKSFLRYKLLLNSLHSRHWALDLFSQRRFRHFRNINRFRRQIKLNSLPFHWMLFQQISHQVRNHWLQTNNALSSQRNDIIDTFPIWIRLRLWINILQILVKLLIFKYFYAFSVLVHLVTVHQSVLNVVKTYLQRFRFEWLIKSFVGWNWRL